MENNLTHINGIDIPSTFGRGCNLAGVVEALKGADTAPDEPVCRICGENLSPGEKLLANVYANVAHYDCGLTINH